MIGCPTHVVFVNPCDPAPDIIVIDETVNGTTQVFGLNLTKLIILHAIDQLVTCRPIDILIQPLQSEPCIIAHFGQHLMRLNSIGAGTSFPMAYQHTQRFSREIVLAGCRIYSTSVINALPLDDPTTIIVEEHSPKILAGASQYFGHS